MGEERGQYRVIHSVLTESPEFLALAPDAKLVFYTLRCCKECNLACIFPFYPETLPGRTGLKSDRCQGAWDSLCDSLWIAYQYPILWIRNGLKFSPGISLENPKHVVAIQKIVSSFPKLEIVAKFCTYYGLPIPSGYPMPMATDTLPDTGKREEVLGKREEGRGIPPKGSPRGTMNGFSDFWSRYPRKEGIGKAEEAWIKHVGATPLLDILEGIGRWEHSEKWREGFIPMPATWLNQKRWRDTPLVKSKQSAAQQLWDQAQREKETSE